MPGAAAGFGQRLQRRRLDAADLVERGLDQVNPEERPDIRPHHGLVEAQLGLHREIVESVGVRRGIERGARLLLVLAEIVLQREVVPELAKHLGREQHAFLIEQLVAFLHEPPLVLQFEECDAGRDDLAAHVRHRRAPRDGA